MNETRVPNSVVKAYQKAAVGSDRDKVIQDFAFSRNMVDFHGASMLISRASKKTINSRRVVILLSVILMLVLALTYFSSLSKETEFRASVATATEAVLSTEAIVQNPTALATDEPSVKDFRLQVIEEGKAYIGVERVSEEHYEVMFIGYDGILPPIIEVSFPGEIIPMEEINLNFDVDGREYHYFPAKDGEFYIFFGETYLRVPNELEVGESYYSELTKDDFPVLRIIAGGYSVGGDFQNVYYVTSNKQSYEILVNENLIPPNDKVFETNTFDVFEFLVFEEVNSLSVRLESCSYQLVVIPEVVDYDAFNDLTLLERMETTEAYVYPHNLTCSN